MSVWDTPSTKLATAKALWEISDELFYKAYGPTVYPTLDPDTRSTTWERTTTWDEVADTLNWDDTKRSTGPYLEADIRKLERVKVGACAVYDLVWSIYRGKTLFLPPKGIEIIPPTVGHALKYIVPSTQATPALFLQAATKLNDRRVSTRFAWASDGLKYMVNSAKWTEFDDEYASPRIRLDTRNSEYVYRRIGDLHIFLGKGAKAQKALAFSKNTYDFLIGACDRIYNACDYVDRAWANLPARLDAFYELLMTQVKLAARLRPITADKVAKAWHEVKTYAQYVLLESIMDDALVALREEFVTDGLAEVVDFDVAVKLVSSVDAATTLELVHLYKWMPPPEYDISASLPEIRRLHENPRRSGAHPLATKEQKEIYAAIKVERKLNFLEAYRARYRKYPDNLVTKGKNCSYLEAEAWDHRGALKYEQMGSLVAGQIKDKATVRARMEDEIKGKRDIYEQNYLLWYLANSEYIDTRRYLDELSVGALHEEAYSRVSYKAEGQKVNGRPFFIAPPKRRLLLGEYEGNNSNVARVYPGSLIGRDDKDKNRMCTEALDVTVFSNSSTDISTTYVVTFDVSKWSPKSCGAQVQEYHDFWAEVYGDERLKSLGTIGCHDTILNTTDGLVFSYKNTGADLEGYRTRTSTMYHADLLATACRRALLNGNICGKSNLVVFVDDGAVKIEAAGVGEVAKANALAFLEIMKEVYNAAGQEIHSRKVIISERGGEILSNFHLDGVRVPQGLKAAMKLAPAYDDPIATLPGELDALFAASQGAVKAGADPFVTYTRYLCAAVNCIVRYERHCGSLIGPRGLALSLFVPKSFGGFGLQSFQGLVSTTVVNATAEGVAILNRVARYYPDLARVVNRVLLHPVLVRDPLSKLRDPTRVRLAFPTMVESRIIQLAVDKLKENSHAFQRILDPVIVEEYKRHATALAEEVFRPDVISASIVDRMWRSTPLFQLESTLGKFKKADTIIGLLGYREVGRVRRKNQKDVVKILTCMGGVLSH